MIELLLLFLGVYGSLAVPHVSHPDHDRHRHRPLDNEADIIDGRLPGTENLDEKALPVSRLLAGINPPASNNLAERSQIPQRLPGTGNLAEKRIPDDVLKRLARPSDIE